MGIKATIVLFSELVFAALTVIPPVRISSHIKINRNQQIPKPSQCIFVWHLTAGFHSVEFRKCTAVDYFCFPWPYPANHTNSAPGKFLASIPIQRAYCHAFLYNSTAV